MKGQTRIFEEVLLFAISIAIFVTCLAIFQMYQQQFSYISLTDQTREIGNMVQGHLTELSRLQDVNASIVVAIPRQLSGEPYRITLNDTSVTIITDDTHMMYMGSLHMISEALGGSLRLSGTATSGNGQIIIYKRGNNIILE